MLLIHSIISKKPRFSKKIFLFFANRSELFKFVKSVNGISGKLTVYYGCMFSGKTKALIDDISNRNLKDSELLVLKPSVDSRSGNATITTHDGRSHPCLIWSPDMELSEVVTPFTRLIALDEAQFFDKIFLSEIKRMLSRGIDVAASGLNIDFLGRPFGLMSSLIGIANEKNHLKAVCAVCGGEAEYSYRTSGNKVLILIGHSDFYEPRCAGCLPSDSGISR